MKPFVKRNILRNLFVAACVCLAGCSEKVRIAKDYMTETPESLPDGHPGTKLFYVNPNGGKQLVWGTYFNFDRTNTPYHDGMLVFEGPDNDEPGDGTGAYETQLYAIRGAGPAVLITQRVSGQPKLGWIKEALVGMQIYGVETTATGIRATFVHDDTVIDSNKLVKEVSWDGIKDMLDEGATLTNRQNKYWGSYVILPIEKPMATPPRD